jgi:CBS domain containing-hemolysin-like protein
MGLFYFTVATVLIVWAICSLAEASVYAVGMPYVRQLEKENSAAGRILRRFKENMERPISAILIVNTVVAAAGASVAGAQASVLFGEANLWWFSACFTVAALFFSEIIPKILGIAHNRLLARILARPLSATVLLLYPLIWMIQRAAVLVKPRIPVKTAPEHEVQQMAEISAEEGSIMPYEADLVRNVLDLDKISAAEIMTPISVVTKIPDNVTLGDLANREFEGNFSRLPLFKADDPGSLTGFVLTRDVLAGIARDRFAQPIRSLAQHLGFVSETAPAHQLLKAFLKRRTHMFGVIDTDGNVIGIVTLEDVLESLIGEEIVDELDTVVDMQALARLKERPPNS